MLKKFTYKVLFASILSLVGASVVHAAPTVTATTSKPAVVQKTKKTVNKKKVAVKKKATKKASNSTKASNKRIQRVAMDKPLTSTSLTHVQQVEHEAPKRVEPMKLAIDMKVPTSLKNDTRVKEFSNASMSLNELPAQESNEEDLGQALAYAALDHLGIRYRFGGTSPANGFDCSGLIYYTVDKNLGVKLPRTARVMATIGEKVDKNDLQPGDLVFFNTRGHRNSHVGIYLGDNQFIHAPRTGRNVSIESLNSSYWTKHYNGARRITKELTTR